MLFFSKKKADPSRPNPDWPWSLSVGGTVRPAFTWETIRSDLSGLYPDSDSFLILEQKDPKDSKKYWYIQSAIAVKGPDQGKYTVGCGWPGETGPVLMERCFASLDEVTGIFARAFRREALDLTGYQNFFD